MLLDNISLQQSRTDSAVPGSPEDDDYTGPWDYGLGKVAAWPAMPGNLDGSWRVNGHQFVNSFPQRTAQQAEGRKCETGRMAL